MPCTCPAPPAVCQAASTRARKYARLIRYWLYFISEGSAQEPPQPVVDGYDMLRSSHIHEHAAMPGADFEQMFAQLSSAML